MMKLFFSLFIFIFFLSSCEKEELPVAPHDSGNIITATVSLGSDYKWQVYYDLKTNTVVGQNLKTAWDLAFESDGHHIFLNSAKAMYAFNTHSGNFAAITDTNGFYGNRKWDEASGNTDSTAIGDWLGNNDVYIIDRGYDESGIHQGFRKIQFLNVDNTSYAVHFSELNGTNDTTMIIVKDTNYNCMFLSFTNSGNIVNIEPPKNSWDLVFTQYTHIFYNEVPVTPYLVTGCLLNQFNTFAKMDSTINFPDIDFDYTQTHALSSDLNIIGYNWKEYVGSTYITRPEYCYIIQDSEGFFYKLHFIDFYDDMGEKGNPKWELQQL